MSDLKVHSGFDHKDVEVIQKETLYDGFFSMEAWHFRHRLYGGGESQPVSREVLRRGDAVAVLLYDPAADTLALIEQIRAGALASGENPWCLEIVAGIVEPGESAEEVAIREAREEAGVDIDSLEHICRYMPSPGGCDEHISLYCGLADLSQCHGQVLGLAEEQEDILVKLVPAEPVLANIFSGLFVNSPILIALQWLQRERPRLRKHSAEPVSG